jgi:hypothetical protein
MAFWFNGAQIISNLLAFPSIFFLVLLLAVIQRQYGFGYAATASLLAWIPSLGSHMSAFSGVFFVLLVALACEWRPWSNSLRKRLLNRWVITAGATLAVLLLIMAVLWCGGMKSVWRPKVLKGEVSGSVLSKAQAFVLTASEVIPVVELETAIISLSQRMSSGIGYFGCVLQRVPIVVPHENGKLTMRALNHVLKPRFLFPEKPNLGSDSFLIRQYAGQSAAGLEQGTSIGLGYMGEFYIDFGFPLMFVALFVFGVVLGSLHEAIAFSCPSYDIYRGVLMLVFGTFTSYDGELAKDLGGMLQMILVFTVILYFIGPWMHRTMSVRRMLRPL